MSLDGGTGTDSPVYRCTKGVVSHLAANSLLLSPRRISGEETNAKKNSDTGNRTPSCRALDHLR